MIPNSASLPAVTALARAGAVERAWEVFEAGWGGDISGDPAALAVRGRLSKDRARLTAGGERAARFAAAARDYGAAHTLAPAPYLAINAATAWLLAGEHEKAAVGARDALALLDGDVADTPYYLAATRAEALLLLGERERAETALAEAVRADPDGWDDRAVTLAQLREILVARGEDTAWLKRFAPPASLHFAGHMGLASGGLAEAELAARVDALIAAEPIGFAWGALAAGADLVIAERLLAAGAELHAVLPCPAEAFAAQSVAPAGEAWLARFRAVHAAATALRVAADTPASVHDPLATAFAGELAIGGALANAARLGSSAVQLVVLDEAAGGPNTARQAALWRPESGPQRVLTAPRDAAVEALFPAEMDDPARALIVHVAIDLAPLVGTGRAIAAQREVLAAPLRRLPIPAIRARPDGWDVFLTDPAALPDVAAALLDAARVATIDPPAIGAELAIAQLVEDPLTAALQPHGTGSARARTLAAQAPAGLALAGDALAVTLLARGIAGRTQLYHPGDDAGAGVHALLQTPF